LDQSTTAVGAEENIWQQNRLQGEHNMEGVIDGENEVDRDTRAVASDPYRHLLFREAVQTTVSTTRFRGSTISPRTATVFTKQPYPMRNEPEGGAYFQ
jgi:hypothetical protein